MKFHFFRKLYGQNYDSDCLARRGSITTLKVPTPLASDASALVYVA